MKFEHDGIETKKVGVGAGGLIGYVRKGLICKSLDDTINLNSEIILPLKTISRQFLLHTDLRAAQTLKLFLAIYQVF